MHKGLVPVFLVNFAHVDISVAWAKTILSNQLLYKFIPVEMHLLQTPSILDCHEDWRVAGKTPQTTSPSRTCIPRSMLSHPHRPELSWRLTAGVNNSHASRVIFDANQPTNMCPLRMSLSSIVYCPHPNWRLVRKIREWNPAPGSSLVWVPGSRRDRVFSKVRRGATTAKDCRPSFTHY